MQKKAIKVPPKADKKGRRKAVRVRGVRPIPWPKRTAEDHEIGAPVWVSLDGKVAHPFLVIGQDERFDDVPGARFPAGLYGFRRDEVRSTPELACVNMVTL